MNTTYLLHDSPLKETGTLIFSYVKLYCRRKGNIEDKYG